MRLRRWTVVRISDGNAKLGVMLRKGWEPFGAVEARARQQGDGRFVYVLLRKRVWRWTR